jgi:hypothetical protein
VAGGAQVLMVQSNNATYGGTGQIEQQFAITRELILFKLLLYFCKFCLDSGKKNQRSSVSIIGPLHHSLHCLVL